MIIRHDCQMSNEIGKVGWNVEWRVTRGSAKSADLNPLRGSSDNLITGGRTVAKKAAKKAAPEEGC
jgi:hypothetical protein